MITKTTLLLIIGGCAVITAAQIAWEWWRDAAARKAQERAARSRDMHLRHDRLKRELVEHHQKQLWLEYVNEETVHEGMEK